VTEAAAFDARLVHTDHEVVVVVHGEIDVATCGRLWPVIPSSISPTCQLWNCRPTTGPTTLVP
jgi:hypothetical protein